MNYKAGTQTRGGMKSVMRYISQLSKTLWKGQPLISGIGCQPETAFDEFLSTKLLHHKDGGVMFYHMVQSFPKGADIDPCAAHEAARRLAGYFEGCEVLVCTHVDREHIHSHCIINSVNFETGKKVHMADEQIQELRVRNDEICEDLGLPKFQKDEQRQARGISNAEYYTASKGESWKFELMRVIDECMRYAGNRKEFLTLLRAEGYQQNWDALEQLIAQWTPKAELTGAQIIKLEKKIRCLEDETEAILMEWIRDRANAWRYDRMIQKREEEIAAAKKQIEELQNISSVLRDRQTKLKRDISMIDDILAEGAMTEAHLRMLVEKIYVQETDGKLSLDIQIKAPFRTHLDVYENGTLTER